MMFSFPKAVLSASLVILVFSVIGFSQPAEKESVPVLITDKNGKVVESLKSDQFEVSVNGKNAVLSRLSSTGLPKDIGFVIDLSLSDQKSIDEIKSTLLSLIQTLKPEDRMQIVGFDSVLGRPTPLTSNRIILENHVRGLNFGFRKGSHFRDAVFEAVVNQKNEEGRLKVLILLSGGIDTGSKVSESQMRTALNEAKAVKYVIQYFEPGVRNAAPRVPGQRQTSGGFGTGVRQSIKYLQSITDSSGGSYVFNRSNYRRIIGGIIKETDGFRLADLESDFSSDVNKIKISAKSKKIRIRYRKEILKSK